MSYLVLARKWRPQSFTDLVGQEHVRRTLENAIAQNRVAHAFLFTGVRGVGKTTSARILAKALNCESGPTGSPCLKCSACVEIAAGSDVDVQEIDGASYNGVDEVRRLQESLPYRPQRDRFKIFIVDEVHMLSQQAWNAFLKTLEEPPPHVKFIFATTEVHKVPITILSRCQRYDFKMIPATTIAARLRYVLGEESIEADDAAVSLVAREASGSMRDAMSLLDQAIAWGGQKLIGEEVARVLGVASRAVLHDLAAAMVDGRAEDGLKIINQLVENGYDLTHAARDLLSHVRDLVVAKVCNEPGQLLDMSDDERRATIELAQRADADDLVRLHQGFSRSFDDIIRSPSPRAGLEMVLVRLAKRPALLPLDELMGKLADLERRLGGGPQPPRGGGPGGGGGGGRMMPPSAGSQGTGRPGMTPQRPGMGGSGGPTASVSPINEAVGRRASYATAMAAPIEAAPPSAKPLGVLRPMLVPADNTVPLPQSNAVPSPVTQPLPQRQQPGRHPFEPTPISARSPAPSSQRTMPPGPLVRPQLQPTAPYEPEPQQGPASRPTPRSGPQRGRPATALGGHDPAQPLPPAPPGVDFTHWAQLVDKMRAARPVLASALEFATPTTLGPTGVVLEFPPDSFFAEQAKESRNFELLTRTVSEQLGPDAKVQIKASATSDAALTLAKIKAAERHRRHEEARRKIIEHPLVIAAIEHLGAELRDVKFDEDGRGSAERGKLARGRASHPAFSSST